MTIAFCNHYSQFFCGGIFFYGENDDPVCSLSFREIRPMTGLYKNPYIFARLD